MKSLCVVALEAEDMGVNSPPVIFFNDGDWFLADDNVQLIDSRRFF
jgi:hypothetical protein